MKYVRYVFQTCRHPGTYFGIAKPSNEKAPTCPNQKDDGPQHNIVVVEK